MKIIDYFFYLTYRFTQRFKPKDEAKLSAFIHTSVYFTAFLITIICTLGILFDNPISNYFKQRSFFCWMSLGLIISPTILGFRYYKSKTLNDIENQYLFNSLFQKRLIKWTICAIMLLLPILVFIVFRLYIIGHISW